MADENVELTAVEQIENAPAHYTITPQEDKVPGDAAGAKSADHKDHNHPETGICPQEEVVDTGTVIEAEKEIDAEDRSVTESLLADEDRAEFPGPAADPDAEKPLPFRGGQLSDEEKAAAPGVDWESDLGDGAADEGEPSQINERGTLIPGAEDATADINPDDQPKDSYFEDDEEYDPAADDAEGGDAPAEEPAEEPVDAPAEDETDGK